MLDAIKSADNLTEADIKNTIALLQRAICINYPVMVISVKMNRKSL